MIKNSYVMRMLQGLFLFVLVLILVLNVKNPVEVFRYIQSNYTSFQNFAYHNPILSMVIFFVVRFFFAVVSIPGTGVLTLLAGAVFGFYIGSALVLSSISLGVLTAFLLTRYLFKGLLKNKFIRQFQYIDKIGIRYGGSLLFFLRMSEIVPSFAINSFFALTPMKTTTYFRVSFVSIIPGVLLFTNAGLQLSEIQQISDIFSYRIAVSLAAIGLIPFLSKLINRKYGNTIQLARDKSNIPNLRK